jgi:TctA family transporter
MHFGPRHRGHGKSLRGRRARLHPHRALQPRRRRHGARIIADRLGEELGQTINVVNREGAGGEIGIAEMARAQPDGYTLGVFGYPDNVVLEHTRDTDFDFDSFESSRASTSRRWACSPAPARPSTISTACASMPRPIPAPWSWASPVRSVCSRSSPEAKRTSRTPETFEHGNPEGIIAAESATNATIGSSLVPLLALGVPGSPTSAIIAGALVIHGIILGPSLFVNRPDVAFIFLYGMLLTVFAMTIIGAFGIKYFSYVLKIRMDYIVPTVLALALFGAYSLRNSLFDVGLAIALGILGAIFKKVAIPLAPIIIGVVLGPLIESNLARSMTIADARGLPLIQYMLSSTLAIGLLVLVLALLVVVVQMRRRTALAEAEAARRTSGPGRRVVTEEG